MKDDMQPLVRVEMSDGLVFYPRFEKNTKGEWTPTDPSFQEMNRRRFGLERNARTEGAS